MFEIEMIRVKIKKMKGLVMIVVHKARQGNPLKGTVT